MTKKGSDRGKDGYRNGEIYIPAVWPLEVDHSKPVFRFKLPEKCLKRLPHHLIEYRSLGYKDVWQESVTGNVVLETNIESENEIFQIMADTKLNLEAIAKSLFKELDEDDGKSEWTFEMETDEKITAVTRNTLTGLLAAAPEVFNLRPRPPSPS